MTVQREYLISATVFLGGIVQTMRYTTGAGCYYGGSFYEGRVSNPGSLKIMLFGEGTTSGESTVGYGVVVLDNIDGALDFLLNAGFSGRNCIIQELLDGTTLGMSLSCVMEQPTYDDATMSIRIKDGQAALAVVIQPNLYGGANVLPDGVDGTADIAGKPKPLVFGVVFNITPICVNTSKLIYQCHDGPINPFLIVYDKGVRLTVTPGANYASTADMLASAPSPGYFRVCPSTGMFRLGATPIGQLTCDVYQDSYTTAATVAKAVALRVLSSGSIVDADFTALNALNPAYIGKYITEETYIPAVLDEVLGTIGAWYSFDSTGKLRVGRLDAPMGTPAFTLTNYEIQELARQDTQDSGRGLPCWRVNVSYAKNYTIQNASGLAGLIAPSWYYWGSTTYGHTNDIAYGNGHWVVTHDGTGSYFFVGDGVTPVAAPVTEISSIAFGLGLFAIASSTGIRTSPDGITWTLRVSGAPYGVPTDITFVNNLFVVFINASYYYTSADGITWTVRGGAGYHLGAIAYGNGIYVALLDSGSSSLIALTSTDCISWTSSGAGFSNLAWYSIAFGNGVFVAANGYGGAVSVDGINWTAISVPATLAGARTQVIFADTIFVWTTAGTAGTAISIDGRNWINPTLTSGMLFGRMGYGNKLVKSTTTAALLGAMAITYGTDRTAFTLLDTRLATAADATVQTIYLTGAQELSLLNALFAYQADAQAEASRVLSLRKVRRDFVAVKTARSAVTSIPNLGSVGCIKYPRFGYNAGKLFVMLGFEGQFETDDLTLYLWG